MLHIHVAVLCFNLGVGRCGRWHLAARQTNHGVASGRLLLGACVPVTPCSQWFRTAKLMHKSLEDLSGTTTHRNTWNAPLADSAYAKTSADHPASMSRGPAKTLYERAISHTGRTGTTANCMNTEDSRSTALAVARKSCVGSPGKSQDLSNVEASYQ